MRIAVICTDQGIRLPDEDKGASIHLLAIARAFARLGHDVFLVGIAGHAPPPADLACLLFPHPGRAAGLERERRKLTLTDRIGVEAREPLARFRPDVVYERLALFGNAGLRLAARLGVPHAVEVNALIAREEAAWRGLELCRTAAAREHTVLSRTDLRVSVSAELAAQIEALAPGPPTVVVANGVDAHRFARLPDRYAARRSLGLPEDAAVVTFVGALRAWHGLDTAIEALRHLPPAVLLAVAGDGSERVALAARAEALGVAGRVRWLGQRAHCEVPAVLAAADVAIAPYPDMHGFSFSPLKLFEYLAAGVPVVASDVGQVHDVLAGGVYGALVRPGDPIALAEAIRARLADPLAAAAVARAAREHTLRHHRWEKRAEAVVSRIEEVVGALAG